MLRILYYIFIILVYNFEIIFFNNLKILNSNKFDNKCVFLINQAFLQKNDFKMFLFDGLQSIVYNLINISLFNLLKYKHFIKLIKFIKKQLSCRFNLLKVEM